MIPNTVLKIDPLPKEGALIYQVPILLKVSSKNEFVRLRPLTGEEFAKFKNFESQYSELRSRFVLFNILTRNYNDWEILLAELLKPSGDLSRDEKIDIDRRILNFLSSAKSYLDYFERFWKRKFKKTSEVSKFEDYVKKVEAESWAFAFFQDLRNYSQHCGLPTGHYSRNSSVTSVNVNIEADAAELISNSPRGWLKSGLTTGHGRFDLVEPLREYFLRLVQNIHLFVIKKFAPEMLEYHNLVLEWREEYGLANEDQLMLLLDEHSDGKSFKLGMKEIPDIYDSLGISITKNPK